VTTDAQPTETSGALQRTLTGLRRALPWAIFAVCAWWMSSGLGPSAAFPVGTQLPQLDTQLADGSRFSLQARSGQILVLNFWASYCGPCRDEAPVLSNVQAQDVRVVGLTVEPFATADAARYADRLGMRYPVGVADEALLSRFRVQSVPTTYVIDKNGKIVLSRVGAIAKRELEAAIATARDAT
jgi:cytochrome c biogenesis protein CcmG, thiol:disulfide interchange protein DsbE